LIEAPFLESRALLPRNISAAYRARRTPCPCAAPPVTAKLQS
jgi:hypothetical protein